ncbi:MAG: ABC-type multidrug transport system, ATPase component [Parcubacteria group bacterium GW2011_GWC2_44_17]|nr:MAG: ABC-type multidrug transport system, ATPase component [Parcubacteria group bacterium GW2011_GWC2_44_17]
MILTVRNLTKRFKDKTAVSDISFDIKKGEILGLLGPNGAGKSTTIEMILGLISPTEGEISVFGKDLVKNRGEILSRINYSSTYIQFMSRLTVRENLYFFGKLYNVRRLGKKIAAVADELEISDLLHTLFYKLSSGQKTRVILAKTFLNDPEFLLLDEPTASLDPDIAFKVRDILRRIHRERGVSFLYTSHNMSEVEEMCDRVIFLQKGKIVAEGAPEELKRAARDYYVEVAFASG